MLFSKSSHVWACTACLTVFESLALCEVHITQVKCSGAVVQLQTIAYPCSCSFETDTPDEWYDHQASCHSSSSEPESAEASGLEPSVESSNKQTVSAPTYRTEAIVASPSSKLLEVSYWSDSGASPSGSIIHNSKTFSETLRSSEYPISLGSTADDDLVHNLLVMASLTPSTSSRTSGQDMRPRDDNGVTDSYPLTGSSEGSGSRLDFHLTHSLAEAAVHPVDVSSPNLSQKGLSSTTAPAALKRKRARPSTKRPPSADLEPELASLTSRKRPVTYARTSSANRARASMPLPNLDRSDSHNSAKVSKKSIMRNDDDADYEEQSDGVPLATLYKPRSSLSRSKDNKGKWKALGIARGESESDMELDAGVEQELQREQVSAREKGTEEGEGPSSQDWESQQKWSDKGRPLRTAAAVARENVKTQSERPTLHGLFNPTAAQAFAPFPGPPPRKARISSSQKASSTTGQSSARPIPDRRVTHDEPIGSSRARQRRESAPLKSQRSLEAHLSEAEEHGPLPKRRKTNERASRVAANGKIEPSADDAEWVQWDSLSDYDDEPSPKRQVKNTGKGKKPLKEPPMPIPSEGWALQATTCIKLKEYRVPQCVQCIKHVTGDSCRLRNVRELFFVGGMATGATRLVSNQRDPTDIEYPTEFNVKNPKWEQLQRVKHPIAEHMLPVLKEELAHIARQNVILRSSDLDFRVTCDICKTSMFSCAWFCQTCGREVCSDCFTAIDSTPEEERVEKILPRSHTPTYVNHHYCVLSKAHYGPNFVPISRFNLEQLRLTVARMEELLSSPGPEIPLTTADTLNAFDLNPKHDEIIVADIAGIPTRPLHIFQGPHLDEGIFRCVWQLGQPFVVTGMAEKLKIQWIPEYFIKEYGSSDCLIVDCTTEEVQDSTVATFFERFGSHRSSDEILKLKDWPSTADFREAFPELFQDFSETVPASDYTRRDGIMNIASHFPIGTVAPDIGPKMYNAFEASEEPGGFGSTRLHMDMADAVNIMTFASKRKNGDPGFAAWNIYRADDAQAIREFLRDKFTGIDKNDDPIHSQRYFLDTSLRKELWEQKGVRSWRIEQKPGEAVFIPAGCAHQVSNSADCIKVAVDFVSPENIHRCSQLTKEFRSLNLAKAWKEDVLQLRTMLWYAWQSCEQLELSLSDDPAVSQPDTAQVGGNNGT
ncbi:hypothetical protein DL93DRAFT_2088849 [Clavulina sp. PMI_390]|nr:hypothetical protein DL93DRAFT_2088849 [Clavulina sp. PMI_390]